jgi:tRNA A-37 threonylcarbamoyl transferase component Bud32
MNYVQNMHSHILWHTRIPWHTYAHNTETHCVIYPHKTQSNAHAHMLCHTNAHTDHKVRRCIVKIGFLHVCICFNINACDIQSHINRREQLEEERRMRQSLEGWRAMKINPDNLTMSTTVLGRGASSTVFQGVLARGGEQIAVAVKVFKGDGSAVYSLDRAKQMRKKINAELSALTRASAAATGVTKCYGTCIKTGPEGELVCIVMHHYPGSLDAVMRRHPRGLAEQLVAKYAQQLCRTLSHLHDEAIAHRDIKPGNLLISDADEIIISDFGISTIVSETMGPTLDSAAVGTALYMSPEAVSASGLTVQTDMWSFGVVVFEMLTGMCPRPVHVCRYMLSCMCEVYKCRSVCFVRCMPCYRCVSGTCMLQGMCV